MITFKFKCTLKSDVILNVKSASEGNNTSLDFIPGNNFLGIVASKIYNSHKDNAHTLFHSGKVRFGDAHLGMNNHRSLKVPASMFHPKGIDESEECYIHHIYDREKDKNDNDAPMQLKQCRSGFYVFDGSATALKMDAAKSFAIKSAYDRENRRSADEKMYGYESLRKGVELYFSVEIDGDNAKMGNAITEALVGECHIGRSRTAQFGLVKIEKCDFSETPSTANLTDGYATVYADSRLIFLDAFGMPTCQPSAQDFGFAETDTIDWGKSQVRTFQYAPWNGQRQCFDTDRFGIEKGSVIVVKCNNSPSESKYVGAYQNEGFGRVIYNPDFLASQPGTNGRAKTTLDKAASSPKQAMVPLPDTPLCLYLKSKKADGNIYEMVNNFVDEYGKLWNKNGKNDEFASQWGHIRSLAMSCKSYNDLKEELFTKEKEFTYLNPKNGHKPETHTKPWAYLTHGTAEKKWKGERRDSVKSFFSELEGNGCWRDVIVNLAAEMAKLCKK